MVKPKNEQIEKLKKQDRELEKLPSIEKEKKVFSKGESVLKRLARAQKVSFDMGKLARSKRKQIRKIKSKVNSRPRRLRKR